MAFNQLTYTASGIVFAKANSNNVGIALSASGEGTLTDVISPVTFASGTISLEDSNATVSGIGTLFKSDFSVGQYLYYYDTTGDPVLAGKILSISSDTTLTLTSEYFGDEQTNVKCGTTNAVIGGYENFLVRVPTIINTVNQTCTAPHWMQFLKQAPQSTGAYNEPSRIKLEQYSLVNNPQTQASSPLTEVPLFVYPYGFFQYQTVSGKRVYFSTVNDFPKYVFALLDPYADTGGKLPINTLCRFYFNTNFNLNGVSFGVNTPGEDVAKAGYVLKS